MISQFDIQRLRDLPIEGVAERLGLRVSRHKALCPFHPDSHPSLTFHRGSNTYRCFVCGAHGGNIDLVMHLLHYEGRSGGVPFLEACRWLSEEHNVILSEWKPAEKPQPAKAFDATRFERFFLRPQINEAAHRFLYAERRLDPRVVRWCRLNSYRDAKGVNWLQIPYYDIDGRLIGVQSRNLNYSPPTSTTTGSSLPLRESGERVCPRFKFPQNSKCHIYNLPVLKLLKAEEPLFITEGCSDCWSMLSSGHKAIAIPSATLLRPDDIGQITLPLKEGWGGSFHMYPDQDAPGTRLFLQLKELMPDLIYHPLPDGCKDYSDYYLLNKQ